jgi:hypothetical protein
MADRKGKRKAVPFSDRELRSGKRPCQAETPVSEGAAGDAGVKVEEESQGEAHQRTGGGSEQQLSGRLADGQLVVAQQASNCAVGPRSTTSTQVRTISQSADPAT